MNILVCLKIQPDPEKILLEDYEKFERDIDLSYAGLEFNCFDSSGLEIGLKLKEEMAVQGVKASCTAFTIGEKFPNFFCENLYSIGYDNVVFRKNTALEFQPENVAKLISEYAKEIDADFIIMGKEASMAETGMVPYYLSNLMNYEIVNNIEYCHVNEAGVEGFFRNDEGLFERTMKPKSIICIGNSPEVLRVSTLRQRLLCRGKKPQLLDNKPNFDGDNECIEFSKVDNSRCCKFLDISNKEDLEVIRKLLLTDGDDVEQTSSQNVYDKYKDDCIYFKTNTNEEFIFNELLDKVKEFNPKVILLKDSLSNREISIKLSKELGTKVIFGSSLNSVDEDSIVVEKYIMGSNLIMKQSLPLGSIILVEPSSLTKNTKEVIVKGYIDEHDYKVVEKLDESNIQNSSLVIACGNGLGKKENVVKARQLSEQLNAGFGLTRPGALNGWGSPNEIIGQSGYKLSPNVTLCLGVAGAAAFMIGVEKSNTIVAVNTDKEALIFKQADYGLIMDVNEFVDVLLELIG